MKIQGKASTIKLLMLTKSITIKLMWATQNSYPHDFFPPTEVRQNNVVSGEVFGHDRSKSQCFQILRVKCHNLSVLS
jgi:hypothetical protein